MLKREAFGDDFHWGVSTAAYQIEGAYNQDGKGLSIWDDFTLRKGKILNNQNGNVACDFYERYQEDIRLMQALNIPNFRFSISWSRIFPDGTGAVNRKGVDFYHRVIDYCLELNIEPWITLYHWDLPLELHRRGGWVNRDIISWFSEYVSFCIKTYGGKVKRWMVLNEPTVFTGAGYFLGVHAPGEKGLGKFLPAVHHVTMSQAEGARAAKSIRPDIKIGSTFSCSYIEPLTQSCKDIEAAKRVDALLNRAFIEPLLGMGYPIKDLPLLSRLEKYVKAGDEKQLAFDMDFIGIQNYTREIVRYTFCMPAIRAKLIKAEKRKVATTVMGWEVYPESIYKMLKKFSSYENIKELIVTENGAAFPDNMEGNQVKDFQRQQFIEKYLAQVLRAKREGVNVNGYFVWSFTDNFEWAEGTLPRFGLVYVDYPTQKRVVKDSGKWFEKFLGKNLSSFH